VSFGIFLLGGDEVQGQVARLCFLRGTNFPFGNFRFHREADLELGKKTLDYYFFVAPFVNSWVLYRFCVFLYIGKEASPGEKWTKSG
jgi:hypothetical protein